MTIHPKVAMGGLGGSIAVIVIWGLTQLGYYPTPDVSAAMATLFSFIAGYLTSGPEDNPVNRPYLPQMDAKQRQPTAIDRLNKQLGK